MRANRGGLVCPHDAAQQLHVVVHKMIVKPKRRESRGMRIGEFAACCLGRFRQTRRLQSKRSRRYNGEAFGIKTPARGFRYVSWVRSIHGLSLLVHDACLASLSIAW